MKLMFFVLVAIQVVQNCIQCMLERVKLYCVIHFGELALQRQAYYSLMRQMLLLPDDSSNRGSVSFWSVHFPPLIDRGGKSSSNIAVGERLLSALLTEMDGLEQAKGILILAATNRPHAIDAALMRPGRFDLVLYVPPPDLEGRYEILNVHTRTMKVDNDVDLKQIAEDTELFTGAELEGLCREAGIVALREDISATVVCNRHFQTVRKSLKPALTREEVNAYSSFMKNPSLMSSGSFISSAKGNSKHKRRFLGSVGPVSFGVISFILLGAAKYLFMHANHLPNELATT